MEKGYFRSSAHIRKTSWHHDRKGGFIKLFLVYAAEQLAVVVLVNLIERLDQDFDSLAHLPGPGGGGGGGGGGASVTYCS